MLSVNGSFGRIFASTENDASSLGSVPSSSTVRRDQWAIDISRDFRVAGLGRPRDIGAGMTRVGREAEKLEKACFEFLGEHDQNVVGRIMRFSEDGVLPGRGELLHEDLSKRIAELNAADTEQTPHSRRQSILQAGMEWFEPVKGPGLNLLNIVGHAGFVVVLATLLREVATNEFKQAFAEGDSSEAASQYALLAAVLVEMSLIFGGAVRSVLKGTSSLSKILSYLFGGGLTVGLALTLWLNGTSQRAIPAVFGGFAYAVGRGLGNGVFPLQNNAGDATTKSIAAVTVAHLVGQSIAGELRLFALPSNPAVAGSGHNWIEYFIQGGITAFGVAFDDVASTIFKRLFSNTQQDSALSDPATLLQEDVTVRVGAQLPSKKQWADAVLDIGAMRLAALIVGALAKSMLDEGDLNPHVLTFCLAVIAMITFLPLVLGTTKRNDNSYTLQENAVP